jgi:hypothetical protein
MRAQNTTYPHKCFRQIILESNLIVVKLK